MAINRYYRPYQERYLPATMNMIQQAFYQRAQDYATYESQLDQFNQNLANIRAYDDTDRVKLQGIKKGYEDYLQNAIEKTKGNPTQLLPYLRSLNRQYVNDISSGGLYNIQKRYNEGLELNKRVSEGKLNPHLAALQSTLLGTGRSIPDAIDFGEQVEGLKEQATKGQTVDQTAANIFSYLQSRNSGYLQTIGGADEEAMQLERERMARVANDYAQMMHDSDAVDSEAILKDTAGRPYLNPSMYSFDEFDDPFITENTRKKIQEVVRQYDLGNPDASIKDKTGLSTEEAAAIEVGERYSQNPMALEGMSWSDLMDVEKRTIKLDEAAGPSYEERLMETAEKVRKEYDLPEDIPNEDVVEIANSFIQDYGVFANKSYQLNSQNPNDLDFDIKRYFYDKETGLSSLQATQMYIDGEKVPTGAQINKLKDIVDAENLNELKSTLEIMPQQLVIAPASADDVNVGIRVTASDVEGKKRSQEIIVSLPRNLQAELQTTADFMRAAREIRFPDEIKNAKESKIVSDSPLEDQYGKNTSYYIENKNSSVVFPDMSNNTYEVPDGYHVSYTYNPASKKIENVLIPIKDGKAFKDQNGNNARIRMQDVFDQEKAAFAYAVRDIK